MEEDRVMGRKTRDLSGTRRTLSMDGSITRHCDKSGTGDKDSELGTQ